ncbi:hypothetical protein [Nostoc sp.]
MGTIRGRYSRIWVFNDQTHRTQTTLATQLTNLWRSGAATC